MMAILLAETLIMLEHPFSVGARVRKLGLLSLHQQAPDELGGNLLCLSGRRRRGGGAGRAWWLWEWLCEEVLRAAG